MKKKIMQIIKKYSLITPRTTLIAAISGGPDSIAMLHVIRQLTWDWGVKIHVAHFNHMFRGKEAEEEASFVAFTAQGMGLDSTVEAFDVPSYLKKTGLSPEEGARSLRYDFLQRVAVKLNGDFIMTAHHANDQAETVLLHLLRGTGPEGLAAIYPREGNLIRPMLGVTKEEIITYCQENNLEYRLDPSNNEGIYTRNQVRLGLIPYLTQFNPQIVHSLVRTADICRGENDLLNEITRSAMEKITVISDKYQVSMNHAEINSYHPSVQRRLVRKVLDDFTGVQGYLSFDHTEEILNLKQGKEVCLPGPINARREQERWIFSKERKPNKQFRSITPVYLQVPGITYVPELNIKVIVEIVDWPDARFSEERNAQVFNLRILEQIIGVRNRCPGDRFRPKGMTGRQKLKNFMINKKISVKEREEIPLIFSGDEIIWVVGYRTGEETGVSLGDQKAVVIIVKSYYGHK